VEHSEKREQRNRILALLARDSTPAARLPTAREEELESLFPARLGDVRAGRRYFLSAGRVRDFLGRLATVLVLLALDVAGLAGALFGALTLRELYAGQTPVLWSGLWETEVTWLPFVVLVTALVFWHAGLYGPRELRPGFGQLLGALAVVGALTLAFAVGAGHEFSTYGLVPTAVVLAAVAIGLLRSAFDLAAERVRTLIGARRRALLIGEASEIEHLHDVLGSQPHSDYEVVGALTPDVAEEGTARLGALRDLHRILRRRAVDEIIVAEPALIERDLLEIVDEAHREGVKVRVAPRTTDILARRGRYVPGHGVPLFELRPPAFAGTQWAVKRAFDVIVASAALALGAPLWLAIAAGVKVTSPGPVLYRDRRVGLNEREFSMLKFRTMAAEAPSRQRQLEDSNEADGALFKLRADPRVTRFGALLRRFSLDEIPQLVNVVRGEMSLVGPRPLPLRDYERLEPWHRKRYRVLPGMTGLWQISGRSNLGFDDLVRLDFYYLENWSVWVDISILIKTIPAVVMRRGAY
jgi:exopolysaccharide biosynthesis polyprenyl glycosylphosphotransferase